MGTDRIETEEFARVGRRRKTRIMATWKDKLRRQGTAFPAWGQDDPNALKRPLDVKLDNPRYESMHRMGGSENQPRGRKICDMKVLRSYRGAHLIRTITSSRIRAISTKDCAHLSHRKRASLA